MLYYETANKVLIAVSKSPIQALSRFQYNSLPKALVDGEGRDIKSTTYRLPSLLNTLRDDGVLKFEKGGNVPGELDFDSTSVTITPVGHQTKRIDRDLIRKSATSLTAFTRSRFQDLNNAIPILVGIAGQRLEKEFVAALTNTTYFGAAKSFSTVLDTYDAAAEPLTYIEEQLETLRQYRAFTDFELRCYVNSEVLRVLAKQNEYTGWAQAGGMPKAISVPQMAQILKDVHGVDKVIICDSIAADRANNADNATGLQYTKKELLHFGLYDKRGSYNLKGDPGFMAQGPDGALAIAWAREVGPARWTDEAREVESFTVRWKHQIISPRGSSSPLGIHFDNIFT